MRHAESQGRANARISVRVYQIVPIIVIALALPASAQQSDRSLRHQIESLVSSYAENFNKQNASGIAGLYTKDGVLVNPAGPEKSVEQYYQNAFKTGFNHQDIALEDVSSLGPDAAISMVEFTLAVEARMVPFLSRTAVGPR